VSKKILVVDDEKHIVKIVEFNLRRSGYEVCAAYNGREALEKVENENPDLLILDVMMTELDGFSVCKKLRAKPETEKLPVIILTAKGQEIDRDLASESGATAYMTKPFSPKLLLDKVSELLKESK
jgi:DNA-binding response OmpR family regulator